MALSMWQGASFTAWLPTSFDCPESCEQKVLPALDEIEPVYMDADQHSDADQSSTVLRKRHCDDLAELDSSSWDTEGQQQLDSNSMKRVCSGLNCSFAEGHGDQQQCIPVNHHSELHSEPSSPGAHSRGDAPLHISNVNVRPHAATSSSPVAAVTDTAAAASSGALGVCSIKQEIEQSTSATAVPITRQHRSSSSTFAAGSWQLRQGQGAAVKTLKPAGDSSTRATGSRSSKGAAAATKAGGQGGAATTGNSKAASKRLSSRRASETHSHESVVPGAQKASNKKSSSSSNCGGACKGPRVRLGGRVLSPEEAEKYLKEVAAAAQAAAAAAKAAAAKEVAEAKPAAAEEPATRPAAAGTPRCHSSFSRAASPSLDAVCVPAAAAPACPASPQLLVSPHASSLSCQLGSTTQVAKCTAPMAVETSLTCTADNCTAGDGCTADHAAVNSLPCDAMDMMDQLTEEGQLLPSMHQYGWSSIDASMGIDTAATAADNGLATVIGSAGSAACGSSSLATAVQMSEAEAAVYRSPFQVACPAAVSTPRVVNSCNMHSMHSRNGSSASLSAQTPTMQHGSLYKSSSMPISMGSSSFGKRQPLIWEAAARSPPLDNTAGNLGFVRSGSASLAGLPGSASSPAAAAFMSCNSLSSLPGAMTAASVIVPATAADNETSAAAAATAEATDAATAAAEAAAREEAAVDAELQQLLAHWNPAAAATAPMGAATAPTSTADVHTLQQHVLGGSAPAGPSAVGLHELTARPRQQQPLVWKPAFPSVSTDTAAATVPCSDALSMPLMPPPAAVGGAGGTTNVRIKISRDGVASLVTTGRVPPVANAAAAAARSHRAKKAPRAQKSKPAAANQADLLQAQQPLQFDMQMQQVQADAQTSSTAAAAPQTRIVVHLKPDQQQQLMAMVDRIVQQRLMQSYEAGFRAASQMNAMGGPAAAAAAAAAGAAASPASLARLQTPAAVVAAAATAVVPTEVMQMAGMTGDACVSTEDESAVKSTQLVDDILPSMQELLSDI